MKVDGEAMDIIEIRNLTKDYGYGRGIFDVSFSVKKGECYGFLGPNGAGKTTTIRHLMGFSRPQSGKTLLWRKDAWQCAPELKEKVGYLPGEIAFPAGMTGSQFLLYMKEMRKLESMEYCEELLKHFELEPDKAISEMSLGVKRKLAVVTAFMHDPELLILDEPTSGLDPLMQEIFISFIQKERERGKTILLSSHMFHEVEAVCDRISIIKDGKIVSDFVMDSIRNWEKSSYDIIFQEASGYEAFFQKGFEIAEKEDEKFRVRVSVDSIDLNRLVKVLAEADITDFQEIPYTLEEHFMKFYREEKRFEGMV